MRLSPIIPTLILHILVQAFKNCSKFKLFFLSKTQLNTCFRTYILQYLTNRQQHGVKKAIFQASDVNIHPEILKERYGIEKIDF